MEGWGPAHECDRKDTMYDPNYDPNTSLEVENEDDDAPPPFPGKKEKPVGIATMTTSKDRDSAKDEELTPILKHKPVNNNEADSPPKPVQTRITLGKVRFGEDDETNV